MPAGNDLINSLWSVSLTWSGIVRSASAAHSESPHLMANKDQNKRTDNKNKPKLTVKEKKERKAKKTAAKNK